MKYLVLYLEEKNYNIDGEAITTSKLQAINLENRNDEQMVKGFQCITFDLKKCLVKSDSFQTLPAVYDLQMGKIPAGMRQKGTVKVISQAKEEKAVSIPNRGDQVLVLGGKWIDGKIPETGKIWKGTRLDMIDPATMLVNDENTYSKGSFVQAESVEGMGLGQLPSLPGWYRAQYESVRNAKGEELERLAGLSFVEEFKFEHLQTKREEKAA